MKIKTKIKNIVMGCVAATAFALSGIGMMGCDRQNGNYDFTVGINQFLRHPALDMVSDTFQNHLGELMAEEGKTIRFDFQSAGQDVAMAVQLAVVLLQGTYA